MTWDSETYLWLLLLIPLLGGTIWFYGRIKQQQMARYFDEALLTKIRRGSWPIGRRLRAGMLLGSFFFLILALAGPMIGTEVREVESRGLDMVVLLDLSRSMNAEDVRPSRLEKAKFEIGRLIDRSPGDRIGLVVFTGEAYAQSPVTQDHSALRMFLDIAETGQMPVGTTNFRSALTTAHGMFERIDERPDAAKVALVFSDGEDHGPSFDDALEALIESGVLIYTVGIGTASGARIPVYDEESGERIGYYRSREEGEVITRLQPETLERIASRGGGSYYPVRNTSEGVDAFLSHMDELQRGEVAVETIADYSNRYQVLLLIGLLLMATGLFLPQRKPSFLKEATSLSDSPQ